MSNAAARRCTTLRDDTSRVPLDCKPRARTRAADRASSSACRASYTLTVRSTPVMLLGCTSDAGKSFLATALCRHLANRGVRVAPFKAQNMSNNAAVTPDGAEIGRAQHLQALAARVVPQARMNPVLLKPSADTASQAIIMGGAHNKDSAL